MSRTRKTRPLHVRMLDEKDHAVGLSEVHNHTNGRECDLPARDAKEISTKMSSADMKKCHYSFEFKGVNICGCRMCTGQEDRKLENRKRRHESKEALHETVTSHYFEDEDVTDLN